MLSFDHRPIVDLKLRPFPNRHPAFQFIHNPLARLEPSRAMFRSHSKKKRCFTRTHKPDAMIHDNLFQPEFLHRRLGNQAQLMLRHGAMRFVLDALNLAAIFQSADRAPKIDNCPRSKIDIPRRRFQARFGQQNFTN